MLSFDLIIDMGKANISPYRLLVVAKNLIEGLPFYLTLASF